MEGHHISISEAVLLFPNPACPDSFAGESIVAYMTAVLTDILHTQRDPLALCLLLQSYDKFEPASLLCGQQLAQFHRYYSLWIPEQAQEALVSYTHCSLKHFCTCSWTCSWRVPILYSLQSQGLTFLCPLLNRGMSVMLALLS